MSEEKQIDEAFEGVYCFDATGLKKARACQSKAPEESLIQYEKVIKEYEKILTEILPKKPRASVMAVTPLCIIEESKYEAGLKQRASIDELAAKIYLAKGMICELRGQDPKDSLKKAALHYDKLAKSLESLAATCSPFEDVAQIMFECEAESAVGMAVKIREAYKI
jgi:hypothetical protein